MSPEGEHISAEEKKAIVDWISDNADRYWFSDGGPLCRPDKGGADIVIVSLAAAKRAVAVSLAFVYDIVLLYNFPRSPCPIILFPLVIE